MALLFQSKSRFLGVLAACCILTLLLGCGKKGPPTGTITGHLTIGEKPFGECKVCIRSPTVQFGNRATRVAEDGSFELVKVPVGKYDVMIAPIPEIEDPMDPTPRPPSAKQVFAKVDRKFGRYKTSGVSVTVSENETTSLDLDLSK